MNNSIQIGRFRPIIGTERAFLSIDMWSQTKASYEHTYGNGTNPHEIRDSLTTEIPPLSTRKYYKSYAGPAQRMSAPLARSSSTTSLRPLEAASCKGVTPRKSAFAFTSTPAAKHCLTASMSPLSAASSSVSISSLVLPPCLRRRSAISGCLSMMALSSRR